MKLQPGKSFKKEYAIGPAVLILGILGILLGLVTSPDRFPVVALYLAGIGSIWSVCVAQEF